MSNWWGGKALDQNVHEQINVMHYPGTRQLCVQCDEPTGRCEEDSMYRDNTGPLCEACYKKMEVASTDEGRELKIRNAEAAELRRELEEVKRQQDDLKIKLQNLKDKHSHVLTLSPMPIQRETFSYAYGVSVRRDAERTHYVGIHTFPMPIDPDDVLLIGGVLCFVETVDNDGCITVAKFNRIEL